MLLSALAALQIASYTAYAEKSPRNVKTLTDWEFRRDHDWKAGEGWTAVKVPHDWAITGPFSKENDLQVVAVVQNGEKQATEKTGRSGGLPYMGKGCYRTFIDISGNLSRTILFDGAMSEAQVLVNGVKVGEWPYGYNSFSLDITGALRQGRNEIVVLLENRPFSSRWYPGAGLYRKVRLIETNPVHIPVWGVFITTPKVSAEEAGVRISTNVEGAAEGETLLLRTRIFDNEGRIVAERTDSRATATETLPYRTSLSLPRNYGLPRTRFSTGPRRPSSVTG